MDINPSTISKVENGKFGITVDYLVRFSIFFNYEFKVIERRRPYVVFINSKNTET